jgi:predicted metal-dependent hydrolase
MTDVAGALAGEQRIRYGDEVIRFRVRVQPDRRVPRVAIHVEPDGRVLVDAPSGATSASVLAAVRKRSGWISRHVEAARERRGGLQAREYVSGESLLYLGRRYRLKVAVEAAAPLNAALRGAYLVVTTPQRSVVLIRDALDAWYRQRAKEVLTHRLEAVAATLRWVRSVPEMRLRNMTVQWGSCSPAGRITLNPMLVKAPRECIDYVMLHELIHLRHHNHGAQFYRTLDRHMPGWQALKRRLDDMAEELFRA